MPKKGSKKKKKRKISLKAVEAALASKKTPEHLKPGLRKYLAKEKKKRRR